MSQDQLEDVWTAEEIEVYFASYGRGDPNRPKNGFGKMQSLLADLIFRSEQANEKMPKTKAEIRQRLLAPSIGIVGRSKVDFPIVDVSEMTKDEKEARRRRLNVAKAAKFRSNQSETSKTAAKQRAETRKKKLEEQKRQGTHKTKETIRDRDLRLWNLFDEHVDTVTKRINWRQLPNALTQNSGRFNPKRSYVYLSPLRRHVFWSLVGRLRNFVARIGVGNFYGSTNYRWSITQWFSIIIRVARRVKLNRSRGNDCWFVDSINSSGRNQILVAGKQYHTASVMACLVEDRPDDTAPGDYMWTTSHRCHNALCVRPNHLCWERHDVNVQRSGCVYGSAANCLHDPSCLWVDSRGRFLKCRNNFENETNRCKPGCQLNCFARMPRTSWSLIELPVDENLVQLPVASYRQLIVDMKKTTQFTGRQKTVCSDLITLFEGFIDARSNGSTVRLPSVFAHPSDSWKKVFGDLVTHIESSHDETCWKWTGYHDVADRPRLQYMNNWSLTVVAKVLAILRSNDNRPEFVGKQLDNLEGSHLCSVGNCVNWRHLWLEPGTVNKDRKFCSNGSIELCPHEPSCLFVSE